MRISVAERLLKEKGGEESAIFPAKPNIKNPLA
jgi:hypothetical protein